MRNTTKTMILALALAAGGCSTTDFKSLGGSEILKNAQGHVIGMKETVSESRTGEQVTRISLFTPRLDTQGNVVGYEETVKGGTVVLRDLDGKRIGNRFVDLRSRASNPGNRGITIVFHSKPHARSLALAEAPSIDELRHLARLTN